MQMVQFLFQQFRGGSNSETRLGTIGVSASNQGVGIAGHVVIITEVDKALRPDLLQHTPTLSTDKACTR